MIIKRQLSRGSFYRHLTKSLKAGIALEFNDFFCFTLLNLAQFYGLPNYSYLRKQVKMLLNINTFDINKCLVEIRKASHQSISPCL